MRTMKCDLCGDEIELDEPKRGRPRKRIQCDSCLEKASESRSIIEFVSTQWGRFPLGTLMVPATHRERAARIVPCPDGRGVTRYVVVEVMGGPISRDNVLGIRDSEQEAEALARTVIVGRTTQPWWSERFSRQRTRN